jgi:hypothetical protein
MVVWPGRRLLLISENEEFPISSKNNSKSASQATDLGTLNYPLKNDLKTMMMWPKALPWSGLAPGGVKIFYRGDHACWGLFKPKNLNHGG